MAMGSVKGRRGLWDRLPPVPTEQILCRIFSLRPLLAAPWHASFQWAGLWPCFSVTACLLS